MKKIKKEIKIKPRGKYVLIKPDDVKTYTSSVGLAIPGDVEKEQRAVGVVLDVGSEVDDLKKGDRVIYGAYSGEKIGLDPTSDKVDYLLVHTDDVIGFVE